MTDESTTSQEPEPVYDWDFFLAHPGADLNIAHNLYMALQTQAKVFLDAENLLPGDDWDVVLVEAQRSSLISIVFVTPNTEKAYYQREEIAAAIQMAREDPRTHRVVPIYLQAKQIPTKEIPYGLRLKHSLVVPESGDLTETGQKLLKTLQVMKLYEAKKVQVVAEQRVAIAQITNSSSSKAEMLAGFKEVTKLVGMSLKIFIILSIVMPLVLVVGLFAQLSTEVKQLWVPVTGSLCLMFLLATFGLIKISLNYSQQIAQGRINGG